MRATRTAQRNARLARYFSSSRALDRCSRPLGGDEVDLGLAYGDSGLLAGALVLLCSCRWIEITGLGGSSIYVVVGWW